MGARRNPPVFFLWHLLPPTPTLDDSLSLTWSSLARLVGLQASIELGLQAHITVPGLFNMASGERTQVLMFAWQTLYCLCRLSVLDRSPLAATVLSTTRTPGKHQSSLSTPICRSAQITNEQCLVWTCACLLSGSAVYSGV